MEHLHQWGNTTPIIHSDKTTPKISNAESNQRIKAYSKLLDLLVTDDPVFDDEWGQSRLTPK